MLRYIFPLLVLLFAISSLAGEVEQNYEKALATLRAGDRATAAKEFRRLARQYPQHILCGNFHFWTGEALLGLGRTEEALAEFLSAASAKYSNKEAHARFMVGSCYSRMGKLEAAKTEWLRFIRDFPNDELTPKVRQRLRLQ